MEAVDIRQEVVLSVEFIGLTDELDINVYGKRKMQDNGVCMCARVCVCVCEFLS